MSKMQPSYNITKWEKDLVSQPETYWIKRGERAVLKLFQDMARRVPAYKDFLKQSRISPEKIQTISDLQYIPAIDKDNYLRKYDRSSLSWDGGFPGGQWVVSSTSGSTGEPFYFPRQHKQDLDYALLAELYLRTNFLIHKRKTLYIVAFPMGVWIGGVFTYEALRIIAERGGYDLSIITTGINKQEIIKAIKNIGQHYDQIIIGSYGPFLKDILDDGVRLGLNWKKYQLGFVFSAEGFSEEFRNYVSKKTGLKNIFSGTLNHYGIVDLGTVAYETPVSILMRRLAVKKALLRNDIFGQTTKLPTLTQYLPEQFYFEEVNNRLYCSSNSGLPLMKYDLKDHGGLLGYSAMQRIFANHNINIEQQAKIAGITQTVWRLPFVHVYERSDFSVSFYAFQIYPESVKKVLLLPKFQSSLTGKFTMAVNYNKDNDQVFEIFLEKKFGKQVSHNIHKDLAIAIQKRLLIENSEYRRTTEEYGLNRTIPQLHFLPYEDATYFMPGTKQKWIKK